MSDESVIRQRLESFRSEVPKLFDSITYSFFCKGELTMNAPPVRLVSR